MILVKHNPTGKYYYTLLAARRDIGISGGKLRGKVKSREIVYESVKDELIGNEIIVSGEIYKSNLSECL
jgi:hypothetical protein